MVLSGWGRFPRLSCHVQRPRSIDEVSSKITDGPLIARGMGRAYGDSAMNAHQTIDMRSLNRMLAFDSETGQLVAEAGVMLGDVIEIFLPRGWFPAVTPGTKFVSIGGMIAADVHGKNHHIDGGFGNFVDWIDVMGPDGSIQRCSDDTNPDLFNWTLGGMGLTGIIIKAAIRLRKVETAWIRQQTIVGTNLQNTMDVFEQHADWRYSVAWIDCLASGHSLGRSLVMLGDHATISDLNPDQQSMPLETKPTPSLTMPINAPTWALNNWTMRAFNAAYYQWGARHNDETLVNWNSYFYPLDQLLNWNKLYGKNGFMQFQCVLPQDASRDGLQALLTRLAESKCGTFLSVLKKMGPEEREFSFPMAGYTLCLDFPVNTKTLALMEELDQITLRYGGRFYLAKDSRMSRDTFQSSETRVDAFRKQRAELGVIDKFESQQSDRISL